MDLVHMSIEERAHKNAWEGIKIFEGDWKDRPCSKFQTGQILLVRRATLETHHRPMASPEMLQCLRKACSPVLCSSLNEEMFPLLTKLP